MKMTSWLRLSLFVLALTIVGCNLFNPSGEGDPGDINLNEQGEIYFRNGQYQKAMDAFERAIAKDSANSMAYYGFAKSAVALYRLDKILILDDVAATASNPSDFAFLQHSDSILTLRLQAGSRVRRVLSLLTDRDSLTLWYKYLSDSSAADTANENYDSLFAVRRAFIQDYIVKGDVNTPGYRSRAQFPLTDFRMAAKNIVVDYLAFDLLYTITRLYDLDTNNIIDANDALMKKLKFGAGGGFGIDSLSAIAADIENDTATTQNLNNLVASMASGMAGTAQLAGLLGGGGESGDSTSTEAQTSGNVDSVIASMGDAILFYQFGDKIDNDGDGCVDEEIMDEKDNDFDGFVDEDARVIPADKPDGVDNNLDGLKDPFFPPLLLGTDTAALEAPAGATLAPSRPNLLKFVHNYLIANPADDNANPTQTRFIKIKKGAPPEAMTIRLNVQKDSLLTKRLPNGKLPASLTNKLQNAVTEVGGCWRNIQVEAP